MEIRKIASSEIAEIIRGYDYAYFDWCDRELEPEEFDEIDANVIIAAYADGKIAGSLANYSFLQSIRGVVKNMGGIGGVWTYPEYRDKGYVRELIKAAFVDMRNKKHVVSMLIPFRPSFYGNFGYVTSNSDFKVKAPMSAFMPYLAAGKELNSQNDWQCDRVNAAGVKDEFLAFMLEVAAPKHHGINLPMQMSQTEWQNRSKEKQSVFAKYRGNLVATALYTINSDFRADLSDRQIYISDMYWKNLNAKTMLFNFFAKHRDQIRHISLNIPTGTNFHQWLGDAMTAYEVEISNNPYMVRVVDVEGAIADLNTPVEGEVTFVISDDYCDWNNGTFSVSSVQGKLEIARHAGTEIVQPDIKATIKGISALVYGTLSLEEIAYKKWLEVLNPNVANILEQWFPVLPLYNTFRY